MPTLKNRPFLREFQNDDAYPLPTGVAGPGLLKVSDLDLTRLECNRSREYLVAHKVSYE